MYVDKYVCACQQGGTVVASWATAAVTLSTPLQVTPAPPKKKQMLCC